jgi:putative transposase
MLTIILSLFSFAQRVFQTRAALQVEILALRHQLLVLQGPRRGHRLRLSRADRFLWVWLSRLWSGWRSALIIVKPETVIAWHRKGFPLYWKWKSRHPEGRPSVSLEFIELIHRMSLANPGWGAPRIHGELLKLGFELSQATVAKYLVRHRRPPSQNWRTFLKNHMNAGQPSLPGSALSYTETLRRTPLCGAAIELLAPVSNNITHTKVYLNSSLPSCSRF